MIYMVEMDFRHPEREAEWHAWYLAHIRVLLTVPGFRASQRFQAIVDDAVALSRAARGRVGRRCSTAPPIAAAAARPRSAIGASCSPTGTATCSTASTRRPDVPADAHLLLLRDDARDVAPARRRSTVDVAERRRARPHGRANAASRSSTTRRRCSASPERDHRVRLYRPISEKIRSDEA